MSKHSVLLVFGGESSEHDISILSARNVYAAMSNDKYDTYLCYIDKMGKWWLLNEWSDQPDTKKEAQLVAVPGASGLVTTPGGKVIHLDVVLPILHGKNGEDGTIQGLCAMLHTPIAGPSLIGAAITMDKDATKRLLRDSNVPVVDWLVWHTGQTQPSYADVMAKLGSTVFVKPANAGSSIGVTKATSEEEYNNALNVASQHDSIVLVERAVAGREIEIAVLGNGNAAATQPGEIVVGEEFYTFDDKYSSDAKSSTQIPADLPPDISQRLQAFALEAYRLVRGRGMARVDFFVTAEGEIFLNEINSIPGFTNISMYPKLWQAQGMKYPELIDRLIELALE